MPRAHTPGDLTHATGLGRRPRHAERSSDSWQRLFGTGGLEEREQAHVLEQDSLGKEGDA